MEEFVISETTPRKAFEFITNEMGMRAVAVALYRIITTADSPEDLVLVVENETRKKKLATLIKAITEPVSTTLFGSEEQRETLPFYTATEEEYKSDWERFAGKELCMVEKETTVTNPGVDLMENALKEALGTLALTPIDRLRRVVGSAVSSAIQIKAKIDVSNGNRKNGEKRMLQQILKTTLRNDVERNLVKRILEIWGIEV